MILERDGSEDASPALPEDDAGFDFSRNVEESPMGAVVSCLKSVSEN